MSTDANRIGPPRFGGQVAFDPDLVPPGIAEVILVEEPFVAAKLEAVEPDRVGVVRKRWSSDPADPVIPAVDAEAMEVGVSPAEGDLDDGMEINQGAVAAHQKPPPDHGADLADPDMELVDLGRGFLGHGLGSVPEAGTEGQPPFCPGLLHLDQSIDN